MVEEVFGQIDTDSSGEISAAELLYALRQVDTTLSRQDILDFLVGCDEDLNTMMSYTDFCSYFPTAMKKSEDFARRRTYMQDVGDLTLEVFERYRGIIEKWLRKFKGGIDKLKEIQQKNAKRELAGNLKMCREFMEVVDGMLGAAGQPPSVNFPDRAASVLGVTKVRMPSQDCDKAGAFALDVVITAAMRYWKGELTMLELGVREATQDGLAESRAAAMSELLP